VQRRCVCVCVSVCDIVFLFWFLLLLMFEIKSFYQAKMRMVHTQMPSMPVRDDKTSTQTCAQKGAPRGHDSVAGQGGPVDACECPFLCKPHTTVFVHLFSFQLLLPRMYISIDLGQLISQPAHLQSLFIGLTYATPIFIINKQRHLSTWKKARENVKKKRRRKFSFLNRR
jgi:hypothetical protein